MTLRIAPIACALLCSVGAPNAFAQNPTPLFVDVTEAAGLSRNHRSAEGWARMAIGTGAAWFDFDLDGDLDLYLPHGKGKNDLFQNNGDGTFTEVADSLGAGDRDRQGSAVAVADYDNDGWPDLFLANADEDALLRNLQGQGFADVTAEVGLDLLPDAFSLSAAWGDYNGDGYLDLYVANHVHLDTSNPEHQDRLLFNDRGLRFVDVSNLIDRAGLNGYGFIGAWTDYDQDGDPDIFLVNDCGFLLEGATHTRVFRNDGGEDPLVWRFTDVSTETGADHCHSGMGLAIGDYDRDGGLDYFYTNIGEETLLLSYRDGAFVDRAADAGVLATAENELWTWGANFFDADLDGWSDLYVDAGTLYLFNDASNDPQPNLFFLNNGDGTFRNASAESGADHPGRSRTSVYGDYDGDGDPDLFLVNSNGSIHLYRNDQATGHGWLTLRLEGSLSNRDGIGARITLNQHAEPPQTAEIRSGSSLGGGDDLSAYFGLGNRDQVDSLTITWPSGLIQTLVDVPANQAYLVREPTIDTANDPLPPAATRYASAFPNPFSNRLQLTYRTTRPGLARIAVYDLLGRRVALLHEGVLPANLHLLDWPAPASLPAGRYLVRFALEDGHSSFTRTVVKR